MQSTAATASAATEEDFMPRARSSGAVLWIVVAEWLHQDELVFEWGRKTYEKGRIHGLQEEEKCEEAGGGIRDGDVHS